MNLRLAVLLASLSIVSACAATPSEGTTLSVVERERLSDLRRMIDHPYVLPEEPYSCFPDRNATVIDAANALGDLRAAIDEALEGDADFEEVQRYAVYHAGYAAMLEIHPLADRETTTCYWQHMTLAHVFGDVLDGNHVVPDEIDESEYSFEPWLD